MLFIAMR